MPALATISKMPLINVRPPRPTKLTRLSFSAIDMFPLTDARALRSFKLIQDFICMYFHVSVS